ncbi:uncharacterized protein LOC131017310 isoform X2 [Salvia miltiorrhiza]|uniref:uncharacterized protein LOC131017310 isoform X2 n=1 Tax=Salvia miltiorrhiza TaxID=226208 RepID=UPI0025AC0EE2|nr:uncharacterized protein LOC131017310 isoform X2 [Salvia miltiorrhiza]
MYGLSRLNSANHISAAAAVYPKRLLRTSIGHSSPAVTAGISDSRNTFARKRGEKPTELSRSVVMLTCDSSADGGVCNVYLVGSSHDCPIVFLELCSIRASILTEKTKAPTMREMVELWKKNKKLLWILNYWYICKCDLFKIIRLCGDFRAANEEAKKYGAKVILGDRPQDITDHRYIAKTSIWQYLATVTKGLKISLPKDIFDKLSEPKYDAHAIHQHNQEIANNYPIWNEIYVHERDLYMSAKILDVARKHKSVVAVVGMGHVPGIQKNWKQPVDVEQLLTIPNDKKTISVGKMLSFVTGVAIVYGIYLSIKN